MDPATLQVMNNLFAFLTEEMGQVLRRTAYSPNIKERMDASCALFDERGRMVAQAEHIPVHLGSMPSAVEVIRGGLKGGLEDGDQVILNDPYQGGSHLNDITVLKPIFRAGEVVAYVVNKAHHADVGGVAPGSMPAGSRMLYEEGVVISPAKLLLRGEMSPVIEERVRRGMRNPAERFGDLKAQIAANNTGDRRFSAIVDSHGMEAFDEFAAEIIAYSERRFLSALGDVPHGSYRGEDALEDDGVFDFPLPIKARVDVGPEDVRVDFRGTHAQAEGNLNAPFSVTLSAVYYTLRMLLDPDGPANAGCWSRVAVVAPPGCLLNPEKPAAVAAGNVETSQRIVDVLLLALQPALPDRVPAQSQGTMNNVLIGGGFGEEFAYYETVGGGEGALPYRDGMSGIQTHMTNTMNTPVEVLEATYPLRIEGYGLVPGSGGSGHHPGGLGVRRELRFLGETGTLSVISERRRLAPRGLAGGGDGRPGKNRLVRGGVTMPLPSKVTLGLRRNDVLVVESPGGGGWGREVSEGHHD